MSRGHNKAKILQAGLKLLNQQGFNISGVQEIADASNVPKGSFYNYFKSKEDFAVEVIELYTQEVSVYLDLVLLQATGSPIGRLETLFDEWIARYEAGYNCGCLAGNLTQELAIQSPKLQQALDYAFDRLQSYFVACLEEAQQVGEIDRDIDSQVLGAFIYNSCQGAMVRMKAQGNVEALEQSRQVIFENLLK